MTGSFDREKMREEAMQEIRSAVHVLRASLNLDKQRSQSSTPLKPALKPSTPEGKSSRSKAKSVRFTRE